MSLFIWNMASWNPGFALFCAYMLFWQMMEWLVLTFKAIDEPHNMRTVDWIELLSAPLQLCIWHWMTILNTLFCVTVGMAKSIESARWSTPNQRYNPFTQQFEEKEG